VTKDLEKRKDAAWRFVLFHHRDFNSTRAHFDATTGCGLLCTPCLKEGKDDFGFLAGHKRTQLSAQLSPVILRLKILEATS
jgi:hypothetical protein